MGKGIEAKLEAFAAKLESGLGPNLVSLLLYGSAARDHHLTDRSDLNLLVVVQDASTSTLHAMAPALAEWSRNGNLPPLVFSQAEWAASADVFPMEIEDMRDAHRIIRGRDPLAGMTTDRAHLRQQLEREVRGKLLHLRTEYAAVAADGKALSRLLENSLSTFLVLFRATLRLKGVKLPAEAAGVIRDTARIAGFSASPFEWALAARAGGPPAALKPFDPVATQYVDAVEQLARFVNGL